MPVVWMPNKTPSTKVSGFVAIMFSLEEVSRRPSDPSSSNPKNNVFWVHVRFLWCKTEQPKTKNLTATFFGNTSKKLHFGIFGRAILDCGTLTSLVKEKNSGRKYRTSFQFFARAKC